MSTAQIDCEHGRGTAGTASAIYEGTVRHRRFAVSPHEFHQRLALAYIDLDELPGLLGGRLVRRRPGVVRFRRCDYLGDPRVPLADAVRDTVQARSGVRPVGPIRLLTNLSAVGHCFNPVSFYYCMEASAQRVQAVVAQVTNTPWGERHCYVLEESPSSTDAAVPDAWPVAKRVLAGSFAKSLHVSPFMGMDHRYEWCMTTPAQTLSAHISSSQEDKLAFDATLSLRRRELTRASLILLAATTLRTLASIYAQAGRLKLKGVPVHAHARVGAA